MPAKGEWETTYFGGPENPKPNGGVNYSVPYTSLPPNDLAPGTVNTQSIAGFLCSSPAVCNPPFTTAFGVNEFVLGMFQFSDSSLGAGAINGNIYDTLIVTNIGVYLGTGISFAMTTTQIPLGVASLIHTWAGGETNTNFMFPGQSVSFLELNGICYFTGLMIKGIFAYGALAGIGGVNSFMETTNYVCGRFLGELAGRMVVAECIFPGGGGTGTTVNPTIAWSGVGIYGQAWDGNPAHDVWNPANQAFFNGNIGGFNLLGDVPDQITGMGTVGQSIILVRTNGLTQQDPNSSFSSSGIQPFNWYHMWSSAQGVGGVVGSVAQFGQMLIFRSSDNVYSLSLSSGLSNLGDKVIARINADQRTIDNAAGLFESTNGGSAGIFFITSYWHFSSIVEIDGQLHYLLSFNAYFTNAASTPSQQNYTCFLYDLNLAESSWHVVDFSQYFTNSAAGSGFLAFSCPLIQCKVTSIGIAAGNNIEIIVNPKFLLFGGYTSLGGLTSNPNRTANIFNLLPFDFDFASNPITTTVALLYPFLAYPASTITFRGEVLSLGHKLSTRRLRILSDNAPVSTGTQQQAQLTLTGESRGSTVTSPALNIQGDTAPTGAAIRTHYFDTVLSDYSVQPSIASVVTSTNAWNTICAFRIASASLIGIDTTASTQ